MQDDNLSICSQCLVCDGPVLGQDQDTPAEDGP